MTRRGLAILISTCSCIGANPSLSFAEERPSQIHPFFVSPDGESYVLNGPGPLATFSRDTVRFGAGQSIELEFLGSNPAVRVEAGQTLSGRANYLLGNNSSEWKRNLATYGFIRYRNLWPGIDLIYRLEQDHLKADFLVAAGAAPQQIRWRYRAGAVPSIDSDGTLRVTHDGASLQEHAPELFQGESRVPGAFLKSATGEVSFSVGQFDPSQPLLIDPLIVFGTYFGGSGTSAATSMVYTPAGNALVGGWTSSLFGSGWRFGGGGSVDGFVASFDPSGALLFCTFIGGSGDDRVNGVALDWGNNIVITGSTTSRNFPVRSAYQAASGGGRDGFLMKLNPYGYDFYFSTYLGGGDADQCTGVATDPNANIYVTGDTRSVNFPHVNALQTTKSGGQDAFVTEFNPGGQIIYSTYLGGGADDHASAIAVDARGEAYVTGSTFSPDFPTAHAHQPASGGGEDAFVTKLNAAGSGLVFSTYFGGSGGTIGSDERSNAEALDGAGNVYVAGQSNSPNFPVTANVYQTTSNGGVDAFAAKFDAAGNLVYSTLLSGSSIDVANAIAVGIAGNAVVGGYTASPDFPNTRAIQTVNHGTYNAFLSSLSANGQRLAFSTFLGGAGLDQITAVAMDRLGGVWTTGSTSSLDFPTRTPIQQWNAGSQNAFVTRVAMGWKAGVFLDGTWTFDQDRGGTRVQKFTFGQAGDLPIVGDWTGTGQKRIGVFRNGQWLLDANGNGIWDGPSGGDLLINFGQAGDVPVVGDWTGSGKQALGIYRGYTWILDLSGHLSGVPTGVPDAVYYFGCIGCIPVVGDWTGTGKSKIGVSDRGFWWLEEFGANIWTAPDAAFWFGTAQDTPVVGDWDGSGVYRPGIFRNGSWILDYNGSRSPDAAAQGDLNFTFGQPNAKPVILP